MSDALNGSVAPFCHSQNRPGGVPVAVFDQPAGLTGESAFVQHQPLGSRKASAARHRRVGGLHQHHLPASPLGMLNQRSLDSGHGRVSSLARHRGLGQIIREVCAERECNLIELETMPDHVHLLVECDPQYGIHRLVKQIKGRSSRVLRQEFDSLRSRLPTLWTNSYFVATVGGAPLGIIKQYVANQRNA